MGKRERMRGTDSVVFGRCAEGRFFAPCPRGAPPVHGDRPTRTREARASAVFRFLPSLLHLMDVSS